MKGKTLEREFYNRNTLLASRKLLGKMLIHEYDGHLLMGMITETEAYIGAKDKACHAYGGKITKRNRVMFEEAGHAYVYLIYGMYNCLNFVTEKKGNPCAVLIRSIEPVEGIETMYENRYGIKYDEKDKKKIRNLSDGPGKLCMAMNITRKNNGNDLVNGSLYVCEYKDFQDKNIISSKRIGIDYAEEAKDFLWRFYIKP